MERFLIKSGESKGSKESKADEKKAEADSAEKKRQGKRQTKCGDCSGCQTIDNCGICRNCRDMKRYGGEGKLKQACVSKKCSSMITAKQVVQSSGNRKRKLDSTSGPSEKKPKKGEATATVKVPYGCINLYNTCYMGVVLQFLAAHPEILELIFKLPTESEQPFGRDPRAALQRMLCALRTTNDEEIQETMMKGLCETLKLDFYQTGDMNEFFSQIVQLLETWTEGTALEEEFKRLFVFEKNDEVEELTFVVPVDWKTIKKVTEELESMKRVPDFLVLQICRAKFNKQTMEMDQDMSKFSYEEEISVHDKTYKLCGVGIYQKKENLPHFTAVIKTTSTWRLCDDQSVKILSGGTPFLIKDLKQAACCLTYSLKNPSDTEVIVPKYIHDSSARVMALKPLTAVKPVMLLKVLDDGNLFHNKPSILSDTDSCWLEVPILEENMEDSVLDTVKKLLSFKAADEPILHQVERKAEMSSVQQRFLQSETTFRELKESSTISVRLLQLQDTVNTVVKLFDHKRSSFYLQACLNVTSRCTTSDLLDKAGLSRIGFTAVAIEDGQVKQLTDEDLQEFTKNKYLNLVVLVEKGQIQCLELYLDTLLKSVNIAVRNYKDWKDETSLGLRTDYTTDEVYKAVAKAVGHSPERLQLIPFREDGLKTGEALKYGEEVHQFLGKLRANQIPKVLVYRKLDVELEEFERLKTFKALVVRQDLEKKQPVMLVQGKKDLVLGDLFSQVPSEACPPSEDIEWRFCWLQTGRILKIFSNQASISEATSGKGGSLGLVEVPVAEGRVFSFYCYSKQVWVSKRMPGVICLPAGSNLKKLETELVDVAGLDGDYGLKWLNSDMRTSTVTNETLKDLPLLTENDVAFTKVLGVDIGSSED